MKGTIKSSKEIGLLFNSGKRINTARVVALVSCGGSSSVSFSEKQSGRVAFIAGKRLGSAPQRSRAKRRMREAVHTIGAPWRGVDVALVAKKTVIDADFSRIVNDMNLITTRIKELESDGLS